MSDDQVTKPYDYRGQFLMEGDPIGWQDGSGTVHVETFKSMGSHGIEVETRPGPVQRAHATVQAVLDAEMQRAKLIHARRKLDALIVGGTNP